MAKETEAVLELLSRLCYSLDGLTREVGEIRKRLPLSEDAEGESLTQSDELNQEDSEPPDSGGHGKGFQIDELAVMHPRTLLDERHLTRIFRVTRRTVHRMVERFEIPPPVRFHGKSLWMAGSILRRIEDQVEEASKEATKEAERTARQFEKLRP